MITSADLILFDRDREKELAVKVTFSAVDESKNDRANANTEKLPILIFSHGLLGSKDGYQILTHFWAQHGYVIIQPTHYDSASIHKPTLTELRDLTPLFVGWQSRPDDIRLVLDQLQIIEDSIPQLMGKLDIDRIGMGGHSFGSHTAMLIGGARLAAGNFGDCRGNRAVGPESLRTGSNDSGRQFMDRRVKAFLLLSPQGSGRALTESADFDQSSWDEFNLPMMIVTGTEDNGRRRQSYQWRSEAFNLCAPGDKFLLIIKGGYHGFGGITGTRFFGSGPLNEEHVKLVQIASLNFFNSYLKHDGSEDMADLVKAAGDQFSLERR